MRKQCYRCTREDGVIGEPCDGGTITRWRHVNRERLLGQKRPGEFHSFDMCDLITFCFKKMCRIPQKNGAGNNGSVGKMAAQTGGISWNTKGHLETPACIVRQGSTRAHTLDFGFDVGLEQLYP
jgi:hypothetical protein